MPNDQFVDVKTDVPKAVVETKADESEEGENVSVPNPADQYTINEERKEKRLYAKGSRKKKFFF